MDISELPKLLLGILLIVVTLGSPGVRTFLQRTRVRSRHGKSLAYFCCEMTFAADEWPSVRDALKKEDFKRARLPVSALWYGMFSLLGMSVISAAGFLGLLVLVFFMIPTLAMGLLHLKAGDHFLWVFYVILLGTSFLYWFKSPSAESDDMEVQSAQARTFLEEIGWSRWCDDQLKFVQESIKADIDVYKDGTDFGGATLLILSSLLLFQSRLGSSEFVYWALGVVGAFMLFRWAFETYRSRVLLIAYAAVIGLRGSLLRPAS